MPVSAPSRDSALWFWVVSAGLFGLCIGSFLNVVIARLPAGESLVSPGSRCPKCRMPISAFDNIPLLSYLVLLGRCRYCKARISARYPFVELLSGLLSAAIVKIHGPGLVSVSYLLLCYGLVAASFIDMELRIIPNKITLAGIITGFALSLFPGGLGPLESLGGAILGGGILLGMMLLYLVIRGIEGMGFGDVKLLAMIGSFIGFQGVAITLVIGSITTILTSFVLAALGKLKPESPGSTRGGNEIKASWRYASLPFGPFLSVGAIAYVLFGSFLINLMVI
ncbi:MAG: prepilin peptidase [Deltaproteobacteria bacterium]|nr:prepilin peptidase [Deltaproteobacteria bacterium]